MTLVNCIASHLLVGSPTALLAGTVVCLAAGALAGFINGCVVVYGRLQPIIATLATGAVYLGIALYPAPDARRRDRQGSGLGAHQRPLRAGRDLRLVRQRRGRLVPADRLDSRARCC